MTEILGWILIWSVALRWGSYYSQEQKRWNNKMLLMPEPPHRSCQGVNMPRKNVLSFALTRGQSSICMCVHMCAVFTCVRVDMFPSVGFTICMCVGVYEWGLRMSQLWDEELRLRRLEEVSRWPIVTNTVSFTLIKHCNNCHNVSTYPSCWSVLENPSQLCVWPRPLTCLWGGKLKLNPWSHFKLLSIKIFIWLHLLKNTHISRTPRLHPHKFLRHEWLLNFT